MSLHTPLFEVDWSIWTTLGLALICGAALSLLCGIAYEGEFRLWGFCVGFATIIFLWLILIFLPVKWSLVVTAALALPIGVAFNLDSRAFAVEFSAPNRELALQELHQSPPESRQEVSKILDRYYNADDSVDLSAEYNRLIYSAAAMLVAGYIILGLIVLAVFPALS